MKSIYTFTLLLIINSSYGVDVNLITKNKTVDPSFINISYNINLETLALIYNLSESGESQFELNPKPRAMLARKLTSQFNEYKNHQAVLKLNRLLEQGFVDSYDVDLSLYSTALPEFKQYTAYPSIYYEHDSLSPQQVQQRFNDFNNSVIQFYQDAKLEQFFKSQEKKLYAKLMSEVSSVVPDESYISTMEDYYGIKRNSYTIIVSAFSFNGIGRSKTIKTDNGINIYQFVTSNPDDESDTIDLNQPDSFTIGYLDKNYFREIAVHELAHSFFDEALRENKVLASKVDEISYLFTDSLKQNMKLQGYINWQMCFEEHLVRLGEIEIAKQTGNREFATQYLHKCIHEKGFIYMKPFQQLMENYKRNRKRYISIQDFIPDLIEQIKKQLPNNGSSSLDSE